ncbi:feruloyl-CoA synthase [Pseudorhodoplanes sp.]|uniref:feruloyl-CoA synthase n=1 Tax=Pseudorhodoplanes sp. TaxID=1934341 RepID=UPI002C597E4E|nr:feruloyl-CoA synthase [Pseudorhodoplanes sp.]HWV53706.1 feruloyl-CoA synthase [Pseudorhodoplanes sp.]
MAQAPQIKHSDMSAPTRPVKLEKPEIDIERRPDGTLLIRSRYPLDDYPRRITDRLVHWANKTPDRTFMAARDEKGEWRHITYAQALQYARCIGQALLSRNLSAERPVAILSGNDLEHAMLALGCLYVGIPYAPISPAYSLISSDFGKLRYIVDLLTPGLVFACDGQQYGKAIEAIIPEDVELVFTRNPMQGRKTVSFDDLAATVPTDAVEDAHDKVGPDTIAKFLFTSGSTGMPKGVINTQRMWCSNQIMVRSALQYLQDEPPTILDWAPWHHTAGGNHDVGLVLYNGGTFYIDEGKPLPGAIEHTVRNLKDVAPTWYFNVPKGFEALLPFFRTDEQLRRNFFSRLKVLWYAGAAIAQHVYDEYQQLAVQTSGERVLFLTGLGSTETAPFAMSRMWESAHGVNLGLPARGSTLKLVPVDGKLEARFKGPHITPGYWRQPELTEKAFDEEGYYKIGDALKFEDENDPIKGLMFDGRIAEDFKLATGTWVSVGPLRASFISHFAPFVRDVVIGGADRDYIAVLVVPDVDALRPFAPDVANDASAADVLDHPGVKAKFKELLSSFAQTSTGSSNRVLRAMLLAEPPSLDVGEITDKGSINQRAVLSHRKALVEEMYSDPPSARVITTDKKA